MIQFIREYGKTIISVMTAIIIIALLGTIAIGGTTGLLSGVGSMTQDQNSNIGTITNSIEFNTNPFSLSINVAPKLNTTYRIDNNNTNGIGKAIFIADDSTANITILKIFNNENNDYLQNNTFCEYNKLNNTISFKKAGTYNFLIEARNTNTIIKKTFKITIPE